MSNDFRGAYGRVRCAWCHKRHRAGTACRVRDRETRGCTCGIWPGQPHLGAHLHADGCPVYTARVPVSRALSAFPARVDP